MAMTALEIFRVVAPEFASIPNEDTVDESGNTVYGVQTYINLWADQISKRRFGTSYEKALAYLTAHKLKMMGFGADEGVGSIAIGLRVGSVSEGETSVSFGTNQSTNLGVDAEYALTIYGLEFLTIKRNAIIPIVSAGEAPLI